MIKLATEREITPDAWVHGRLIGVAARQGNAERGLLREQVRPGLSERHVSAGRMQHDPAVRDCGGNRSAILLGAARQPRGVAS